MTSLEVRRALWNGSIPIKVHLDPSECRTFDQSDPYYLHVPRMSYLPVYLPRIYSFFKSYLINPEEQLPQIAWFEVDNAPIKWHWPIGLLYDFYTANDPTKEPSQTGSPTRHNREFPQADTDRSGDDGDYDISNTDDKLPWIINLRFKDFPSELLMSLESPTACHDAFINAVKEADFARNGTARAVMSLGPAESKQLWNSVQKHHFSQFWQVTDKLLNSSTAPLRNIPLKIYNPQTGQVIQALIPPKQIGTPRGDLHTLGTALNLTVPILFPSRRTVIVARPVMHGIVLPLNAPLVDLMRDAIYPDGFLHITLAMI